MKLKIGIALFLLVLSGKTALALEPDNHAELWRSWNVVTQEVYIDGFVSGINLAFLTTIELVAPDKYSKTHLDPEIEMLCDKFFVRKTRKQIRDVITDLYRDPANSIIRTADMVFLARDKIEGKDIGKRLMAARKNVIDAHELFKDLFER